MDEPFNKTYYDEWSSQIRWGGLMLSGVWAWGAHVVRCVWAGLMLSGVCVGGGPCCQVGGGWGRGRGKDLLMGWGGSPVFILAELGHNPQTVEHLPPPPP